MTTPEGNQAAPPPLHPRALNMLQRKPLTAPRAARIIATVTVSLTVIGGVLIHWTDGKTFPNIGVGMWWAVQTVTTVGYGDVVPKSAVGRLVATVVMLGGISFLAVITAAIASEFIESARRRIDSTASDAVSAKLDQLGARLDVIEAGIRSIGGDGRDEPH